MHNPQAAKPCAISARGRGNSRWTHRSGGGHTGRAVSKRDLPEIYRQIASFKSLTLQAETLSVEERRLSFEGLASPGAPLRLLAQEQLALIDIQEGDTEAAITRLRDLVLDSEATADLQQRAQQAIVALGGELELTPGQ